ncbi:hypothetical protein Droror1_Dr00018244 [Drosera rotundifolia]
MKPVLGLLRLLFGDFDAIKTAVEAAGPVDVFVCNHDVFFPQELNEQDIHEMKLTVDVGSGVEAMDVDAEAAQRNGLPSEGDEQSKDNL